MDPDSDFEPGCLELLAIGNAGRLLDARRTPIVLTRVDDDIAMFEVEILAFEDTGARWHLPFEDVSRFQFRLGATRVDPVEHARAVRRFDRQLRIDCDVETRRRTAAAIEELTIEAGEFVRPHFSGPIDLTALNGDPSLFDVTDGWMIERAVADIDRQLTNTMVSNPNSGERAKGHAIVLAELGLCPFVGQIIRSPSEFDDPWTRDQRARHIISRLALVRAIFAYARTSGVTVYRGLASDGPVDLTRTRSFVSSTFSRAVAEAHFEGGSTTMTAALLRHRVSIDRLFMTFVETRAMNAQFREAEAVLIGDPDNRLF